MGAAGVEALASIAATARFVFVPHTPSKDFAFHALLKSTATRLGYAPEVVRENVVSQAAFMNHIDIGHHGMLLESLYSSGELQALEVRDLQFDTTVVMRGHGLYLCVALNIPCVALATQDKVSGFAHICHLVDYLVDVGEDVHWAHNLSMKLQLMQTDEAYRSAWYRRRDACLAHWGGVANRFHSELRVRFWTLRQKHLLSSTQSLGISSTRRNRVTVALGGSRNSKWRSPSARYR